MNGLTTILRLLYILATIAVMVSVYLMLPFVGMWTDGEDNRIAYTLLSILVLATLVTLGVGFWCTRQSKPSK